MIYYRHYLMDYSRDTADLTLIEHGAYRLLIDDYYTTESPLPFDHQVIYRRLRAMGRDEQHAINKMLAAFFEKQIDGYHHKRIDAELRISSAARAKMQASGKVGASRRWGSGDPEQDPDGDGNREPDGAPYDGNNGAPYPENDGVQMQPSTVIHQPSPGSSQPSPGKNQKRSRRTACDGRTVEAWKEYSNAFLERYGIEPLRNAKVNGQLGRLIDQVGQEEAPKIAAFYLGHNGARYVASGHSVDLMLLDCQKLRTEMLTGRKITRHETQQLEKKDALRSQADRVGKRLGVTS